MENSIYYNGKPSWDLGISARGLVRGKVSGNKPKI